MEGFGYLPWLSEMLRKFACFHSRGAVGIGSSRAAKGRRRGNLILLGGNEERSLCSASVDRPCCCCPGRRVLTKVFTPSLVRKCRIHRIPLRVIYQIHIDPVPHPQPSPAAIMSLQDRFASQDPLSLLSGATTLSLITAASQASLAYNLPVVVCLSLCMPL